jgi:hypothetical protein
MDSNGKAWRGEDGQWLSGEAERTAMAKKRCDMQRQESKEARMKHLQRRTPAEWLDDLICDFIDVVMKAVVPETPKEWVVMILLLVLLMIMAAQGDNINKLYTQVLALTEALK